MTVSSVKIAVIDGDKGRGGSGKAIVFSGSIMSKFEIDPWPLELAGELEGCRSGPLIGAFLRCLQFSLALVRALDRRALDFLQLR